MSLGNFPLGSTVRLPLQVLENGGLPVQASRINSVKIIKILKPDLSTERGYPKSMTLLDQSNSLYYLDYKPEDIGNYIVIYNITINEIVFSQSDSFFVGSEESKKISIPTARPVEVKSTTTPKASAV